MYLSLDFNLVLCITYLLIICIIQDDFNDMEEKVQNQSSKDIVRLFFLENYISVFLLDQMFCHDCIGDTLCSSNTGCSKQRFEFFDEVESNENQGNFNRKNDNFANSLFLLTSNSVSDELNNHKYNQG